ncbi:hypothetical protein Ade02nite_49600 [Paractinoplanes deccanensis]|uniref:Peptidase S8/S53 domain-containing protein n=1 Tax=Paractinoplanes deccanensis TaxID=113561 RepID=A0ABQ3Y8K0_9ACTN|nr:hypothetical protein Ade02nite_49600 [Actinoplanes deccanensis]
MAVVDTGTYPHPDIRNNLREGTDLTGGASGNGKSDANGHGTRMAGLVAGHGHGSDSGIEGVAPSANIIPVRISRTGKEIDPEMVTSGVQWATENGAKVINISLSTGPSFDLNDAVGGAIESDIVVVAPVGNAASDAVVNYPAAFDGVLAVGATGRNGKYSSASVKSKRTQICAPGVDIISTQPKSNYGTATGTSDSTAIVSGAAALVRAKFPQLSAEEVVHRLTATADDIGPPGRDDECGYGRLNIVKALTADVPPLEGGVSASPSAVVSTPAAGSVSSASSVEGSGQEASPGGSGAGLVFGGIAAAAVVGGGLLFFVLRRRRVR